MGKLTWIIIGLVLYFIGGWIAKDIIFSMIEITEETTLGEITFYECLTYSIIAAIFSLVASSYSPNKNEDPKGFIWLIAITKLLQKREMRKDIVIELSYKGFSRASDYS